jgi:putative transposase
MAKPPRDRAVDGWSVYFVTASTWGHRSLFQTERMARLFVDAIFHYRQEGKFRLHEFVIMPDHFHLLLSPPTGVTLERAMQFIKGGFSYRVRKELDLNMEVWERGYVDHRIRDVGDYMHHVEYIRQNPVCAHLVVAAEEYLYSSANRRFELDPHPQGLKPETARTA